MKAIHQALVHGYREREHVAKEVIHSTLTPIHAELTTRLVEETMALTTKAFPNDTFLTLAQHTPDVYLRSNAPSNKYEKSVYSLEYALLTTSVHISEHRDRSFR
ncbi:MAG: hypothetical protein HYU79_04405 [Nitrosomonadales bacterium]|nr:hypothetical protein [Nitrosomonadales bacterium]